MFCFVVVLRRVCLDCWFWELWVLGGVAICLVLVWFLFWCLVVVVWPVAVLWQFLVVYGWFWINFGCACCRWFFGLLDGFWCCFVSLWF